MPTHEREVAKTVGNDWDRKTAALLRTHGFDQNQIGIVLGLLAEHRMCSDQIGCARGYESGSDDAVVRIGDHRLRDIYLIQASNHFVRTSRATPDIVTYVASPCDATFFTRDAAITRQATLHFPTACRVVPYIEALTAAYEDTRRYDNTNYLYALESAFYKKYTGVSKDGFWVNAHTCLSGSLTVTDAVEYIASQLRAQLVVQQPAETTE